MTAVIQLLFYEGIGLFGKYTNRLKVKDLSDYAVELICL